MHTGLGIRPELFKSVLDDLPRLGFVEAHSENYFGESIARAKLREVREHYPVSLHGVGLSLGRADDLDQGHLQRLSELVDEVQPMLVSEHLAWSAYSHRHLPDLLPLPLTHQALGVMIEHVQQMQDAVGQQVLIENPSNYLLFDQLQIPETDFLNELAVRSGCGLLVDVNNIFVSATNLGRDPLQYLRGLDSRHIKQYHLAGYTEVERDFNGHAERVLIDTHNHTVHDPVWQLFDETLALHGRHPTLLEWDSEFPDMTVLLAECNKANQKLVVTTSSVNPVKVEIDSADEFADLSSHQTQFLDDVLQHADQSPLVSQAHQGRLRIYQNNVFSAIQDYCSQVFPATAGVVGTAFFKQMIQLLIQNAPPGVGNLHDYGEGLTGLVDELEELSELTYLKDVVGYEWALHRAYYADASSAIQAYSQEQLLTLPVVYNASVAILRSDYPVLEIWRQSLPDYQAEITVNLATGGDHLLVYKKAYEVHTLRLTPIQALVIDGIAHSENLLQAIQDLGGSIEPEELSQCLSLVFDAQLLEPNRQAAA